MTTQFTTFKVVGPIPRWAPYKKGFRGHLFVPPELRAWRAAIAKAFNLNTGRKPLRGEQPWVEYKYHMVKNHADLDSITHSAQDALTKDALHCVDKEWFGTYRRVGGNAKSKRAEYIEITVTYEGEPCLKKGPREKTTPES